MTSATVQINVVPKRLLRASEAAIYCGRSLNRFKAEVPFRPVRMPNGDERFDVQDCDRWINSLKVGAGDEDADAIVARLGK
jgi:hypothetical protein